MRSRLYPPQSKITEQFSSSWYPSENHKNIWKVVTPNRPNFHLSHFFHVAAKIILIQYRVNCEQRLSFISTHQIIKYSTRGMRETPRFVWWCFLKKYKQFFGFILTAKIFNVQSVKENKQFNSHRNGLLCDAGLANIHKVNSIG